MDVVRPLIQKEALSTDMTSTTKKAVLTVKITDKYWKSSSTLSTSNIQVLMDNVVQSTSVKITSTEALKATINGKSQQYGIKCQIEVSGFAIDKKQMKIRIKAGAITDSNGNSNAQTDFIVYNTLKSTTEERSNTSGFLGNNNIQRQNISNVTFTDSTKSANSTKWDVSDMGDGSILAWSVANGSKGAKTVYIGSNDSIYANVDSSYLFANIGYSSICSSTSAISNIYLLNTINVTNMSNMFWNTGYNSMTTLNLGDNFYTTNVTNMSKMFAGCGYTMMNSFSIGTNFNTSKVTDMSWMFANFGNKKLGTLSLGSNFDTSNVTNMEWMFADCGYTSMSIFYIGSKFNTSKVVNMSYMFEYFGYTKLETLSLGSNFNTAKTINMSHMFAYTGYTAMTGLTLSSNFNTSSVTDMSYMFYKTGYTAMTSLTLGSGFNTSSVKDMSNMFAYTGYTAMTSLTLGSDFDTSSVINMSSMFYYTGYTKMPSLDLGDKFYTANVTNMTSMFYGTGYKVMTSLDLGPAFNNISESNNSLIFTDTGKSGLTIYVSEQIYQNKNRFKSGKEATTSVCSYTRGTINPKYRTEWVKESSVVSKKDRNITITLRGRTNAEAGKDFTSDVESTLTTNDIHVYIDGEEATTITKELATATTTKNATTEANDVLQVLTLSNLKEALRQQGKNYKEWSGNISLKINKKTLKDKTYSNQNLQAIDTSGTMTDIVIKEAANVATNTNGTMFTDYVVPEFTYEYSNTTIDYEKKNLTVIFDVTDKYFKQSTISLNNTTIKVDGVEPDWTKVTRTFGKKTLSADQTDGNIIYKANGDIYTTVNGVKQKIGERYELKLEGLETKNGEGYSGTVTLAFPEGLITDQSNNKNLPTTITIGVDDPSNHPTHTDPVVVDVVNPLWSYGTSSINRIRNGATADTVDVTIIGSDKYYKTNTLTTDKIKVYVDDKLESTITKKLTQITIYRL